MGFPIGRKELPIGRSDFLLEERISYWKKDFLYVKLLEDFLFADFVRCFCGIAMVT